jgi:hypothetical protein
MARYRIEFSRDWIRGRWGYIDRIFSRLGGKETEPSRTENAWFVEFKGKPRELGKYLSERLNLKHRDFHQFGTIFEITEVSSPDRPSFSRRPARRGVRRLNAPTN